MPTVQQIHTIWPTARVLASNAVANGSLYGRIPNPNIAIQIELIGYAVDYQYEVIEKIQLGNTPSASLTNTSNYLYSWCGIYGVQAFALYNSGGIVPTPSSNTVYGLPITATFTATSDSQSVCPLNLPSGARVIFAQKGGAPPLDSSEYSYTSPDLTLLGGIVLMTDEDLTYQYVLPIT